MIYNDLNESTYIFEYEKLKFYFSSQFYMEKFIRNYEIFLKSETNKLKVKYRCDVSFDYLILLLLYKKIEKRGFKVKLNDFDIKENYTYYGEIYGDSFKG